MKRLNKAQDAWLAIITEVAISRLHAPSEALSRWWAIHWVRAGWMNKALFGGRRWK